MLTVKVSPLLPTHHSYASNPVETTGFRCPVLLSAIKYLKAGGNPNVYLYDCDDLWGYPLISAAIQELTQGSYNDQLEQFLELIDLLLEKGADPNQKFSTIDIYSETLSNASCIHVFYAFWKLGKWNETENDLLERIFDRMLEDPRLDIQATFSEELTSGRGCNFHDPGMDFNSLILIEEANLLHYASLLGDILSMRKLLSRDPNLLHSTCYTVKGKNFLSCLRKKYFFGEYPKDLDDCQHRFYDLNLEENRIKANSAGDIGYVIDTRKDILFCAIERHTRITSLHIAAQTVQNSVSGFLIGQGAFCGTRDSSGATPQAYLKYKFSIGCLEKNRNNLELFRSLKELPVNIRLLLPQVHCTIHKKNYSIVYDTRTKVAIYVYECLKKEMLIPKATRQGISFTQDQAVPSPNRSKTTHYTNSGFQRGHLRPAANAGTQEEMEETFKMTNIFPQHPNLNLTHWKKLENHVRSLTRNYDIVEVFTGCLYLSQKCLDGKERVIYEVIGNGKVAVPTHCYKVLYLHTGRLKHTVAYLFPNQQIDPEKELNFFQVSVEKIQEYSGILFNTWPS